MRPLWVPNYLSISQIFIAMLARYLLRYIGPFYNMTYLWYTRSNIFTTAAVGSNELLRCWKTPPPQYFMFMSTGRIACCGHVPIDL